MKYQVEELSKRIRREKIVHKIIKTVILIFLTILLVINLMMLYQTNEYSNQIPSVYSFSVFNIISESMQPNINVNDLIVIKKCPVEEIKEKDIITYRKSDETIVTHRVVRMGKNEEGEIEYTTQGDNNIVEDEEKIKYSQVIGKYIFKIDGAGKFVEVLQKGNGIISIIIIIIIFIILKNSNDKKKEERKRVREKYDIKKKRDEYNKIKK